MHQKTSRFADLPKTFSLKTMPSKVHHERERLFWLARLRWWAMFAVMLGASIASILEWQFVSVIGVTVGASLGCIFNILLYIRLSQKQKVHPLEIEIHIFFDHILLTFILSFSGGILNPFSCIYVFHVLLAALLKGKSGGFRAFLMSILCLTILIILESVDQLPSLVPSRPPVFLWSAALFLLLTGIYYLSWILSTYVRQGETDALKAHQKAENNLNLLSNALDTLNVGLEIRSQERGIHFLNPFAAKIQPAKYAAEKAKSFDESTGLNFLFVDETKKEHLIHVIKVNFTEKSQALLYVDRTKERMVQERHFMLEKLATLGRALQGIAHELNTPLATMQTLAKDMQEAIKDIELSQIQRDDLEESVHLIIEESQRCRHLSQSLLQSAPQKRQTQKLDESLESILEKSVRLIGMKVRQENTEFEIKKVGYHLIPVDSNTVLQILMNLNQNALRACQEHAEKVYLEKPWITISAQEKEEYIEIYIQDKGPGLADLVIERLFEPFVTTHPTGGGTGLGLYTSHRLANDFGGDLTLENHEEAGVLAILKIPKTVDTMQP